jgi:polysaccharide transporter, PST family
MLLRMLSFVPFVVGLNIPAFQTLLAYNMKNTYSFILISGAAVNIALNLFLASAYGSYGTAASIMITELLITVSLMVAVKRFYKKQIPVYE